MSFKSCLPPHFAHWVCLLNLVFRFFVIYLNVLRDFVHSLPSALSAPCLALPTPAVAQPQGAVLFRIISDRASTLTALLTCTHWPCMSQFGLCLKHFLTSGTQSSQKQIKLNAPVNSWPQEQLQSTLRTLPIRGNCGPEGLSSSCLWVNRLAAYPFLSHVPTLLPVWDLFIFPLNHSLKWPPLCSLYVCVSLGSVNNLCICLFKRAFLCRELAS